jgi:hypothetical protein
MKVKKPTGKFSFGTQSNNANSSLDIRFRKAIYESVINKKLTLYFRKVLSSLFTNAILYL